MFPRSMFNALSKKGAGLLEEPTEEHNYGATSDTNSTRRDSQFDSFTSSAPPILEPSTDDPRPPKPPKTPAKEDSSSPPLDPWRTLATVSCREPITTAPVSYRDRPIDEQPILEDRNQQTSDDGFCWTLINGYSKAAVTLRNSYFIYVFQFLFVILQISAIAMGLTFQDKCGEPEVLPVCGVVLGATGVVLTCVWVLLTRFSHRGRNVPELNLCLLLVLMMFGMFTLVEVSIFFSTRTSFDEKADNFCDPTFYSYTFYKQIATGAAAVLATMLYVPGALGFLNFFAVEEREQE